MVPSGSGGGGQRWVRKPGLPSGSGGGSRGRSGRQGDPLKER